MIFKGGKIMKKLKWLALILIVSLIFGMVACKQSIEPHRHVFAKEWTKDANYHWHRATCRHTSEVSDKAAHTFGDWTVTKEATEEAEGSREKSCTVCGYTVPEVIEKLAHTHKFATDWTKDETHHWYAATCEHTTEVSEKAEHTFGNWTTTKEATEEAEGTKERSCTVCGYTATEAIAKLPHTHTFATEWSKDKDNHWHAATCGHTTEVSGKAAHTFGNWTTTKEATCTQEGKKTVYCTVCEYEKEETIPANGHSLGIWETTKEPTETESGKMQRECEVCGETVAKELQPAPEGFRFVKGGTITGTESWTPSSSVFKSGRSLTIPDLIVSDHEVTRSEYKAVMGSDPSTASAYDKDGNKLSGDAVLNNPVNKVSWYDALVYCNKLSMQENLTPCYTINSSTNPEDWETVPTSSDSTWNAATCDFEANGYRLPTAAEWEWLARGGQNYTYAGSNTVSEVAWCTDNTNDTGTRDVKTKAPNGYELYDMSGNVCEWCWDWYGVISDITAADGASSGACRVLRGGSWDHVDSWVTVSLLCYDVPNYHNAYLGFRVVRTATE